MDPSHNAAMHAYSDASAVDTAGADAVTPDAWSRILEGELARSTRYGRPTVLAVLELRGIEALADAWGAELEQRVVDETARCLRAGSRTSDYVARLAPARFGVLLPETDEIAAINYIERVREALPASLPRSAASLGIALGWASPVAGDTADSWVTRTVHRLADDR